MMLLLTLLLPAAVVGDRVGTITPRADSHHIKVPTHVPDTAPKALSSNAFCNFAFEARSFYSYAGSPDHPNDLTKNLIETISNKTQTRPVIRVGGTSIDHSSYNKSQSTAMMVPPDQENKTIPRGITYGPLYFKSFQTIRAAEYVLDIPMAEEHQKSSVDFAKDGYKAIGGDNIRALELGNEPNLYHGKVRPRDWSVKDYVKQWTNWSNAISKALGLADDPALWQAYTLVSWSKRVMHGDGVDPKWTIERAWNAGLKDVKSRIKSMSMHYYQIEDSKLRHHKAVLNTSSYIKSAADFLNNRKPAVPLVLGEAAVTVHKKEKGIVPALVTADFLLHMMSIGVSQVLYQQGLGYGFNLWDINVPDHDIVPRVKAEYYGYVFAAEFIGLRDKMQVASLHTGSDDVVAYAAYSHGSLVKAAIINYTDDDIPGVRLSVGDDTNFKNAHVNFLKSSKNGNESLWTWGGMHWSVSNQGVGKQVFNDTRSYPISNGVAYLDVAASQAIIVTLS